MTFFLLNALQPHSSTTLRFLKALGNVQSCSAVEEMMVSEECSLSIEVSRCSNWFRRIFPSYNQASEVAHVALMLEIV